MPNPSIYLPDDLLAVLDLEVASQRALTNRTVNRSEVVQAALREYLAARTARRSLRGADRTDVASLDAAVNLVIEVRQRLLRQAAGRRSKGRKASGVGTNTKKG